MSRQRRQVPAQNKIHSFLLEKTEWLMVSGNLSLQITRGRRHIFRRVEILKGA
jgi:hypothetical protein